MNTTKLRRRVIAILFVALLAAVSQSTGRMKAESAPVARGEEYAGARGCIDCHGDPGNAYADHNDLACDDKNTFAWHPDYSASCTDVIAWFESVRLRRNFEQRLHENPDNELLAGERLARAYHCFQCHGQLGQGGFRNPKSLKGYIPGYFGNDFALLTRNGDPDSIRQWIMHGVDADLTGRPLSGVVAGYFLHRQEVSMPSFRSLPEEDVDALVSYVIALNGLGPMDAAAVRSYARQTVLPKEDSQ